MACTCKGSKGLLTIYFHKMNKIFVLILRFNLANWMLKELKAAAII